MQQRILFYTLGGLGLALVQKFLLDRLVLYGVAPDMMLVLLTFIAQREGQSVGTTAGFFIGLLMDLLHGTLGIDALSKTVAGFTAGFFRETEGARQTTTFMVAVAVSSIAGITAYYLTAYGLALDWWKLPIYIAIGVGYNSVVGYTAYQSALNRF